MIIEIDKNENYEQEPKVIIRCRELDERVTSLLSLLDIHKKKLLGTIDHRDYRIDPSEVLYFESVDGVVFIYAKEMVYRSGYTLNEIESSFADIGYFRCSKSLILNINSIKSLKSELGNRINACLTNGEHIIISRHYAKQLRAILKEAYRI